MQEAKKIYIEKKDKVICWTDEGQWKMEVRGIELHGDFSVITGGEIIVLEPSYSNMSIAVEITEKGYLSITAIYSGGENGTN